MRLRGPGYSARREERDANKEAGEQAFVEKMKNDPTDPRMVVWMEEHNDDLLGQSAATFYHDAVKEITRMLHNDPIPRFKRTVAKSSRLTRRCSHRSEFVVSDR
ncbi:MAG: hypothetical protein AAFV53_16710 [Myxococcota bacterium]